MGFKATYICQVAIMWSVFHKCSFVIFMIICAFLSLQMKKPWLTNFIALLMAIQVPGSRMGLWSAPVCLHILPTLPCCLLATCEPWRSSNTRDWMEQVLTLPRLFRFCCGFTEKNHGALQGERCLLKEHTAPYFWRPTDFPFSLPLFLSLSHSLCTHHVAIRDRIKKILVPRVSLAFGSANSSRTLCALIAWVWPELICHWPWQLRIWLSPDRQMLGSGEGAIFFFLFTVSDF